jgi:hypothetical protein
MGLRVGLIQQRTAPERDENIARGPRRSSDRLRRNRV